MKILVKILAVFAIIQISACEFTGNAGNRKTTPNETVKIVATIEDSLEGSNVRIEEIYALYENKTKECISGGLVYGAARYPARVVFLGRSSSGQAKEFIDTEKKCPLKLVGFSAKISYDSNYLENGFLLSNLDENGEILRNCYRLSPPPGFCEDAKVEGRHGKVPDGWFALIGFSVSNSIDN